MGGWPRGHRRSADIKEIGFPGLFFTPRREMGETAGNGAPAEACIRCRKIRPAVIQSGPFPRPRQLLQPIRGGCPARQAGPGSGPGAALGTRTPVSGCRAGRRSASRQPPALACPGRSTRGRLTCHRPGPQEAGGRLAARAPADRHPATVPAYFAGSHWASRDAGQGGQLPARRPDKGGPGAALPLVTVAIPVPCSPRIARPPGAASQIGAARTTARVPRVYLPWTSQGPGRETAAPQRI